MTIRSLRLSLCLMAGLSLFTLFVSDACQAASAASSDAKETTSALDAAVNEDAGSKVASTVDGQERVTVSPDQAFVLIAGEAEKGNVDAMLNLGSFYERGFGIARNFGKAKEWYQKAADTGSGVGLYNVGVCYEIGMGTEVNVAKALSFYEKADAASFSPAPLKMYTLYLNGSGVPKDETKAVSYLQKAANAGNSEALSILGVAQLYGQNGIQKNGAEAVKSITKSAEAGNMEAVKNLGVIFKDGIEVKPSPETALQWFFILKKAGYQGDDIDPIIQDLQQKVGVNKAGDSEKAADAWIEKRRAAK
ncbi:sel1 repeat family protein [Desulfovibrio sp. OttesenSCG-928-G15]|nr:sel1 repeat family protein [Desulfovibrio sp. OttesenSCG-928-G15]